MEFFSSLKTADVIVPAEFIDSFMTSANGDYVKVYLWLLKNGSADIEEMAERLQLTEGDVKRAVRYWQEKAVLGKRREPLAGKENDAKALPVKETCETAAAGNAPERKTPLRAAAMSAPGDRETLRDRYRGTRCTEILNRLSGDTEFRELLIIIQKYLSKILDERETQVFAYLYDGLHLPAEVLDYLVAYAVERDRAGIKYIEKLGTDWAENGIRDVKSAKRRVKQFEEAAKGRPAGTSSTAGTPGTKRGTEGNASPRTDYNELVMQELLQNMGD